MNLPDGPVRGLVRENTIEFLGVPYAEPPVGDRRWRPPARIASWSHVVNATRPAPSCVGANEPYISLNLSHWPPNVEDWTNTSEDCLWMNIFAPRARRRPAALLPVLVFFHGGCYVHGTARQFFFAAHFFFVD